MAWETQRRDAQGEEMVVDDAEFGVTGEPTTNTQWAEDMARLFQ